jgi:hypothetical protein
MLSNHRAANPGVVVVTLVLVASLAEAQWIKLALPGTPRTADGRPDLSAPAPKVGDGTPDLSGVWQRVRPNREIPGPTNQNLRYLTRNDEPVPYQPWSQALYERRMQANGTGNPHERCLPQSIPGAMLPPNPFKIIQTPRVTVILYEEGGDYRQVHTDGRTHPEDANPSWWGYSIGRWERDTFVVETRGFNDLFWLDKAGHAHTEALRTTERFRRINFGQMDLEVTIEDLKAYTKPWTVAFSLALQPDTEILEDECENEKDADRIAAIAAKEAAERAKKR